MATLSGLNLQPETLDRVERVKDAMKRAGLEPPESVAMMLEVIGRETEKRLEERAEFARLFSPDFVTKNPDFVRIKPFQVGTDYEFLLPPADDASRTKALVELDRMVHEKILAEFKDIPKIETLTPETVSTFIQAQRAWGNGNAHEATASDILKEVNGDFSISSEQIKILRVLCNSENHQRLEQICGNHLYPGDLIIQKVEADERASGRETIVPNWPPCKRHENTPGLPGGNQPKKVHNGRFEVSVDHKGKSPLALLEDYYESVARLRDASRQIAEEKGIHFHDIKLMARHLHISNEGKIALDSPDTMDKAAGMVGTMQAMVSVLTPPDSFDPSSSGSKNWINVNSLGYASDNQYGFQQQRRYALRGVDEDGARGSPAGHFEVRLGDATDPFGIVYMTAAATGGLNRTKHLLKGEAHDMAAQYKNNNPRVDINPLAVQINTLSLENELPKLVEDPRLNFIPDRVRQAVLEDKMAKLSAGRGSRTGEADTLPPLENARSAPASREAERGPEDRSVAGS